MNVYPSRALLILAITCSLMALISAPAVVEARSLTIEARLPGEEPIFYGPNGTTSILSHSVPSSLNNAMVRTDEDARSVFEELDKRRSAAEYESAAMTMTIHSARGRTRTRELRTWSINRDDITRQLVFFESPADVRGTGLLTITENGEETQRIYLPAVGRVQTIGTSQRSDRFMGSDFTYEDLGQQDPDLFDFVEQQRNDERILLEAVPRRESQYERIHFYIDPERYLLIKAEYFNADGEIFKRLELHDYSNVTGELWRPGHMVMHDLEDGRKTELRWTNRTFDEPIPDDLFTDRQLRRGIPR